MKILEQTLDKIKLINHSEMSGLPGILSKMTGLVRHSFIFFQNEECRV